MLKRSVPFLPIILGLLVCGCPIRTVFAPDGEGETGGSGGAGNASGSAGVAGQGAGGSAGGSETGGAAGTSETGGKGGAGAIGGAAGAAETGGSGTAGRGGQSGSGGVGGIAGQAGAPATGGGAGATSKASDGQHCALAADCVSNTCTPFYVDLDGDGYGAGQAVGFCGTIAPIGYAAPSGDCCDTATNLAIAKLIHPGADFQTTSAGGVCNITWDYDCSGTVETDPQVEACGDLYPRCNTTWSNRDPSTCGTGVDKGVAAPVAGMGRMASASWPAWATRA